MVENRWRADRLGQIRRKWEETGGAGGYFGVPLGGEYRTGNRFAQDFLNGTIFWP